MNVLYTHTNRTFRRHHCLPLVSRPTIWPIKTYYRPQTKIEKSPIYKRRIYHSKRWTSDAVPSTINPVAVSRTSYNQSFETVMTNVNDDIQILAWEVALNDKMQHCSREAAAAADDVAKFEHESRHTETAGRKMKR